MDRVDLSAHTRIEMVDGVWYLITENLTVAIDWPEKHTEGGPANPDSTEWFDVGLDETWGASVIWRIPLTAVAVAYEYQEGEPWVLGIEDPEDESLMPIECGTGERGLKDYGWARYMHRRAAIVADIAEQFKALHTALMEVSDD